MGFISTASRIQSASTHLSPLIVISILKNATNKKLWLSDNASGVIVNNLLGLSYRLTFGLTGKFKGNDFIHSLKSLPTQLNVI